MIRLYFDYSISIIKMQIKSPLGTFYTWGELSPLFYNELRPCIISLSRQVEVARRFLG